VLTATFRYNPAVLAKAFGMLGCLYLGRIVLGVGSGEALNEVAVARIEWPGFKERFARLREAVIEDPAEMEKAANAMPLVTADPDEAVAEIKSYVDAGFNHLVFHGPGHDQERFLRSFAEQVLPRLRALDA